MEFSDRIEKCLASSSIAKDKDDEEHQEGDDFRDHSVKHDQLWSEGPACMIHT